MKRSEALEKTSRAFELLGNPLRFRIYLKVLSEGCDCDFSDKQGIAGNCVSSIMRDLNLPQSTVSTYLKDLAEGGLIECRKQGRYLYCRPDRGMLMLLKSFIDSSLTQLKFSRRPHEGS